MFSTTLRHQLSRATSKTPDITHCKPRNVLGRVNPPFSTLSPFRSHSDLHTQLSKYILQTTFVQRPKKNKPVHLSSTRHKNMAFILPGLRRSLILATPLVLSAPLLARVHHRPMYCDGPDPFTKISSDLKNNYAQNAQTPVIKTSGAPNPRAIRQVSMGSILGVLLGLGVSVFSKPLAVLIGLGIVCVQVREQEKAGCEEEFNSLHYVHHVRRSCSWHKCIPPPPMQCQSKVSQSFEEYR